MSGHHQQTRRKWEVAIGALLACDTLEGAAAQAGLGVSTLARLLKDAEFAEAYRQARQEVMRHAVSSLSRSVEGAVKTLRTISDNEDSPDGARVNAARIIIDRALRAYELEDISARIANIEKMMKEVNQ